MKIIFTFIAMSLLQTSSAQNINDLVKKVRAKLEEINDYEAKGSMKTNVAFLKIPVSDVNVFFKKPNKLKVKSAKGISFIPKGAVSINMSSLFSDNEFTIIDAGTDKIENVTMRVAKLLPLNENSEVVLSTIYINPANNLIYKSRTTTRENGSYQLEMRYGKYVKYGLPDKIMFAFNTKDYKLPKGMTFDFDDGKAPVAQKGEQSKQGRAEISFTSYIINKGIPDSKFK